MGVYFITSATDEPTKIDEKPGASRASRTARGDPRLRPRQDRHARAHRVRLARFSEVVNKKGEARADAGEPPHRHDGRPCPLQRHPRRRACRSTTARWARRAAPRHRRRLRLLRPPATIDLLDDMKSIGFKRSTLAGLSFGITDLRIPDREAELLDAAQKRVDRVEKNYDNGIITERERLQPAARHLGHCNERSPRSSSRRSRTTAATRRGRGGIEKGEGDRSTSTPCYLMSDSGARGNISQMQQLAGMRGLMAKPSRRDHRDADPRELPRGPERARVLLVDARRPQGPGGHRAQDRRLGLPHPQALRRRPERDRQRDDCGTRAASPSARSTRAKRSTCRCASRSSAASARDAIRNPITDEIIVGENEMITDEIAAAKIEELWASIPSWSAAR
jgi:hypothetical protein